MKNLIFIFQLLFAGLAFGQTDLLNSPTRPTIAAVSKQHANYTAPATALVSGGRFNLNGFRNTIEADAPQFIAKLEKAYPNAKFVFMGRDTQLIADIVDGFYRSIGQRNRVVQLGVSKPTLVGLDTDSVMKYLEYFGINMDNLSDAAPIVLVDTISSGENIDGVLVSGRQGRFILQTVYKKWIDAGKDPKDLLKKFNMIGMKVSTFQTTNTNSVKTYRKIENLVDADTANRQLFDHQIDKSRIGNNLVLPLIDDTQNLFNEAGYDHHTATWHDRFMSPNLVGGKLVPNPGQLMNIQYRESVLWMQHQIVDIIKNPNFASNVAIQAQRLGYAFNVTRPIKEPAMAKPKPIVLNQDNELKGRLQQGTSNLRSLDKANNEYQKVKFGKESIKLTENGARVYSLMRETSSIEAEHYLEISFKTLVQLYSANKIGARDLRRILTSILDLKPIENAGFIKMVQNEYKNVLPVEIFLGRENEREKLMSSGGTLEKNYRQLVDGGNLKMSCQFIYGS